MFDRLTNQLVLAVMIITAIPFLSNSFAAADAKSLPLAKALTQVKLFADLSDMDMEMLEDTAMLRTGKAGEYIVKQGKGIDRMFIILDGEAKVLVDGKHIVTLSGQSLVGEMEFLDMLPASADVILVNDTDLVVLDNGALTDLMEKQPRLGYVLMRRIARIECQRLRESNSR